MDHDHFSAYQEASQVHSASTAAHKPVSSPLPPVALPTFPSASVSPGASKYHTRRQSQHLGNQQGISPSISASPRLGSTFSAGVGSTAVAAAQSGMSNDAAAHQGGDASLEEEIERSRQERLKRRTLVSTPSNGDSYDPRDTASARDNIMALASRGTQPSAGANGGASLASFMSGATKAPPRHRIGTGMTEQEKEETERLEKEMEVTRSKWKNANAEPTPSAPTGVSLATLMKGNKADESSVKVGVASRWGQTVEKEGVGTRAHDATGLPQQREAAAMSLAAMMGSKASGPRLNQPAPQVASEEGPAHARREFVGAYALPGMVAANSPGLRSQTAQQVDSSPSDGTDFAPRPDAAKRSSVLDRWNRDTPDRDAASTATPPAKQNCTPLPVTNTSTVPAPSAPSRGWSGPPVGVKDTPHAAPKSAPVRQAGPAEPGYTRGTALPGMISPSPSTAASVEPVPAISRPSSPTSVRSVVAQWGHASQPSQTTATLAALSIKESYGIKVASPRTSPVMSNRTLPSMPNESAAPTSQKNDFLPSQVPTQARHPSPPVAQPAPAPSAKKMPQFSSSVAPAAAPQSSQDKSASNPGTLISSAHSKAVQAAVALALNTPSPTRLPPGTAASTDVYSLLTQDSNPIDHNHMFYRTEILAVVHRQASPDSTTVFVWIGDETPPMGHRVEGKINEILKREGVQEAQRLRYRQETKALGEVFGDQLTICRGLRDDFDHLATRLYSVQTVDEVAFIEEQDLTSRSICSGHCTVFSIVGEVYAWMGVASNAQEQEACFEFAESIADGRQVTVLQQGKETAYFWHGLDGLEIASSYYWRFRPLLPPPVSVIAFESTSSIRRIEPIDLPKHHVSLVDGGFAEHWIVVPAMCRGKKAEIEVAMAAAEELASRWKERGFGFKQAVHVLCAPSKLPIDLPHLARQLDFHKLNGDEKPSKMNVLTLEEARAQLL
ncbi:BQ2448_3090 [Microbotryum intermedium]|uniref:BQ2448_3090 protein n=1 Tax=Microbotryum intermedium TaxID=269621 RepID=A0A238FCE5_9BASI|nr:BQ2448_3090 [Microbotryum intermedium]